MSDFSTARILNDSTPTPAPSLGPTLSGQGRLPTRRLGTDTFFSASGCPEPSGASNIPPASSATWHSPGPSTSLAASNSTTTDMGKLGASFQIHKANASSRPSPFALTLAFNLSSARDKEHSGSKSATTLHKRTLASRTALRFFTASSSPINSSTNRDGKQGHASRMTTGKLPRRGCTILHVLPSQMTAQPIMLVSSPTGTMGATGVGNNNVPAGDKYSVKLPTAKLTSTSVATLNSPARAILKG